MPTGLIGVANTTVIVVVVVVVVGGESRGAQFSAATAYNETMDYTRLNGF